MQRASRPKARENTTYPIPDEGGRPVSVKQLPTEIAGEQEENQHSQGMNPEERAGGEYGFRRAGCDPELLGAGHV